MLRPDGPYPTVFLVEDGWVSTRPNEIAVLIPLLKKTKLKTRSDKTGDNSRSETELRIGEPILIFESVRFQTVPPTPFILVAFQTLPLEESGE